MVTSTVAQAEMSRWVRVARANPILDYIDNALRGAAQVVFLDNPLTGLLYFVAMFWGSYTAGTPEVAIGSVVGTFVSTATAYPLRIDAGERRIGLYGFNGMLVGAGVPTFLGASPMMWVILVIASVISTIVMLAVANVMSSWKVPALTFPFVLTTWLVMLAAYRFGNVSITGLPHAALAVQSGAGAAAFGPYEFVRGSLASIAQVFFIDDPIAGVIFLVAFAVESRWAAALAALGAVLGSACALVLGCDHSMIFHGLWAYSAVLTGPAIGCVFMKVGWRTLIFSALAIVFTIFVQAAMFTATAPVGIPAFTFPFVLTTWLFLLAHRSFEAAEPA